MKEAFSMEVSAGQMVAKRPRGAIVSAGPASERARSPRSPLAASVFVFAVAVLATIGCGGNGGTAKFVGQASNAAVYVTWTRSGDSLLGQLTQARAADDESGNVETVRSGFNGTVSGSSISLKLDRGLGASSILTGTLRDRTLFLDYPGADGRIITLRLQHGDSADYNAALAKLRDIPVANDEMMPGEKARVRDAETYCEAGPAVCDDVGHLPSMPTGRELARYCPSHASDPSCREYLSAYE